MVLSDAEIESRLSELRRRRERLDREIADLVLYREPGHRPEPAAPSGAGPADRARAEPQGAPRTASTASTGEGRAVQPAAVPSSMPAPGSAGARRTDAPAGRPGPDPHPAPARDRTTAPGTERGLPPERPVPPPVAFADDPTGARRYGRALIEAACAIIAQAGEPLHAGEILRRLEARGYTVPGRDPVAALNTRLWKRATGAGPLRRLGEASYALAAAGDGEAGPGHPAPRAPRGA